MSQRQVLNVLTIILVFPFILHGQTQSGSCMEGYKSLLKMSVDTFLLIKSACIGCEMKYSDTSQSVSDAQIIYLLFPQNGRIKIVSFDDFGRQTQYLPDKCCQFDTIDSYKSVLQQKNIYCKKELAELKKLTFLPTKPSHYSFEALTIELPAFKYQYKIVEIEFDRYGFERD